MANLCRIPSGLNANDDLHAQWPLPVLHMLISQFSADGDFEPDAHQFIRRVQLGTINHGIRHARTSGPQPYPGVVADIEIAPRTLAFSQ